jgi:hypothetical protein
MKPRIHTSRRGGAPAQRSRRETVIKRLEAQLQSGTKPTKSGDGAIINVAFKENVSTEPLTDFDRSRIEKELQTLKTRV